MRELQAAGGTALKLASRPVGLLVGTAAIALAIDVVTKLVAVAELSDHAPIRLLGGLLTLRLTRNAGAAFGMAEGATVIFSAVALVVVVVIARAARRLRSAGWAVSLGLILGGALGNLSDRMLRHPGPLRGWVVDWIELPHWPVFNVADIAIVSGALLAVLLSTRGIALDGQREADDVA